MKRSTLIVFIFCIRLTLLFSQDSVFVIHPALGDTIDLKEKMQFDLFTEFKNKDIKYFILYSREGKVKVNAYLEDNSVIVQQVDSFVLATYQSNINKLLESNSTSASKDTLIGINRKAYLYDLENQKDVENVSVNIDKDAIEKSAYEGRRKLHLRTSALEKGMTGQKVIDAQNYGSYGEIKFRKKKK